MATFGERFSEGGPEWRAVGDGVAPPLTRVDDSAGLIVTARWRRDYYGGPHSVEIQVPPASAPDLLERGITQGSLRRAETLLAQILREHEDRLAEAGAHDRWVELHAELEQIAAGMPASPQRPKDADAYYSGLLAAYALAKASGHPAPRQLVQDVLGIDSENTLRGRLRNARRRTGGES